MWFKKIAKKYITSFVVNMKLNSITSNIYNPCNTKLKNRNFRAVPKLVSQKVFNYKTYMTTSIPLILAGLGCACMEEIMAGIAFLSCSFGTIFAALFSKNNYPKLKLDENILFKKAKTIDEAKLFAKNKLGIVNFVVDDLEYANWINEGLTNLSNKFKGEVYFPKNIQVDNNNETIAYYILGEDTINISKGTFSECDNFLKTILKRHNYEYFTKYNFGTGYENFCNLLKKAYKNFSSLSIFEKEALLVSYKNIKEVIYQLENKDLKTLKDLNKNKYGSVYRDKFSVIYHEVGHCFDDKTKSLLSDCINNLKYMSIIKKFKIPFYTKKNTSEFKVDLFAGIVSGEKYTSEIMNILNKVINFKMPNTK